MEGFGLEFDEEDDLHSVEIMEFHSQKKKIRENAIRL